MTIHRSLTTRAAAFSWGIIVRCSSALLLVHSIAPAQWTSDISSNTSVCSAPSTQNEVVSISDGAGGIIVAWTDYRSSADSAAPQSDIFAQRIDASGFARWTSNGLPICSLAGNQVTPMIIHDGAKGAIIAWSDQRSGVWRVYAQRIDSNGSPQWTTNGIPVSVNAPYDQLNPTAISDGTGGAIFSWIDYRNNNADIFAQHIDGNGTGQWSASDVSICSDSNDQISPAIASDDSGGAIIAWEDFRSNDENVYTCVYAQRVTSAGMVPWTANGIPVCTAPSDDEVIPSIIDDGTGGAFIAWTDFRNDSASPGSDIYAQRISPSGVGLWQANGNAISTAPNEQYDLHIVGDGAGGMVICWSDFRNGDNTNIFAQRVTGSGSLSWGYAGVGLYVNSVIDEESALPALSQSGNIIIVWSDARGSGPNPTSNHSIYGQRLDLSGKSLWTQGGIALCQTSVGESPSAIIPDGTGGVIASWSDTRHSSSGEDVFAQKVSFNGKLATPVTPQQLSMADGSINQPTTQLRLRWHSVPEGESYSVQLSTDPAFGLPHNTPDSTGFFISGISDTFATASQLAHSTTFYWRVNAVNSVGTSDWSDIWKFTTVPDGTREFHLFNSWNIVSLPLTVSDNSPKSVFPSSISNAFSYEGTYVIDTSLQHGIGYWLKFGEDQFAPVFGTPFSSESVHVIPGWNLIGTISSIVPLSNIVTTPSNIITSNFWGFDGRYVAATALEPAHGYWIKTNSAGNIILSSSGVIKEIRRPGEGPLLPSSHIIFEDAAGRSQTLFFGVCENCSSPSDEPFSLPPIPPEGSFDVRFATDTYAEWIDINFASSFPISIRSSSYPITIRWSCSRGERGYLMVDNTSIPIDHEGTAKLSQPETNVRLVMSGQSVQPHETALLQNFPNPFNPVTSFGFAVSRAGFVSLKIYDLLGREIAAVVNEALPPGTYHRTWDASKAPSGMYVYTLRTGDFASTKKMLLIK